MQIWAWMKHCARFYRMVISQESDGFSDSPILASSLGYNTSPITARVWMVHFAQDVLLRVGGYNHTHVHSRIICSWMWNQPQTAGVYTRSQCECSCLESAVITAIRVAPTSSKVRAAITSPRSSTLSALFSSNLLLTEWLADKWRFLFFAWGLHRVGQRRRRTLQRNVGKLLLAFFFSHQPLQAVQFTPGCPIAFTRERVGKLNLHKKRSVWGRRDLKGQRDAMKCLECLDRK